MAQYILNSHYRFLDVSTRGPLPGSRKVGFEFLDGVVRHARPQLAIGSQILFVVLGLKRAPEVIFYFAPSGQVCSAFQKLINAELVNRRRSRDG